VWSELRRKERGEFARERMGRRRGGVGWSIDIVHGSIVFKEFMRMLETGAKLPALKLADDTGTEFSTKELLGRPLVVYFYPKDDTPGCTSEATQFRDLSDDFEKKGAVVVGVSRDSVASHQKFKKKYEIPFRLLADVDSKVCDAFGVIVEKNMYGKKSMGVQRSTFLFDAKGKLVRVWPKVSVDGHAEDVLSNI
jgi:thioredoxin-dependent peroxiredoxin